MTKQPSAPEKIDTILQAAGEVFFEHGYSGARVDEIARRAGVNKAMLYYHVGDKRALFTAVLLRNLELARKRLEEAASAGGRADDRLRGLARAMARTALDADHLSLVLREATSGGERLSDEVLARLVEVAGITRAVVAEGRQREDFRDVSPLLAHLMMVSSVLLLTISRPVRKRMLALGLAPEPLPDSPDELGAAVADVLLHGLLRRHDTRERTTRRTP